MKNRSGSTTDWRQLLSHEAQQTSQKKEVEDDDDYIRDKNDFPELEVQDVLDVQEGLD